MVPVQHQGLHIERHRRTYEAEAEDYNGAECVCQCSEAVHAVVKSRDYQIPKEVSASKCLDQAGSTSVSPNTFLPVHLLPFLVVGHFIEGHGADEHRLNEGDYMNVPVEFRASRVMRVAIREQLRRQPWRDDSLDEGVEGRGEDDFVDVIWQRVQSQALACGSYKGHKPVGTLEGEDVLHFAVGCKISTAREDE